MVQDGDAWEVMSLEDGGDCGVVRRGSLFPQWLPCKAPPCQLKIVAVANQSFPPSFFPGPFGLLFRKSPQRGIYSCTHWGYFGLRAVHTLNLNFNVNVVWRSCDALQATPSSPKECSLQKYKHSIVVVLLSPHQQNKKQQHSRDHHGASLVHNPAGLPLLSFTHSTSPPCLVISSYHRLRAFA